MMTATDLLKFLWAEAILYFVWLHNQVPTKALPNAMTPLEMAMGERPDLSRVQEWGHKAWVKRTHGGK
ncbi:hypothetical protein AMATHDRAFT_133544, partial [Amanita thiersii Skay4041]